MFEKVFSRIALGGLLLVAAVAQASNCKVHYLDGQAPEIRDPKMARSTMELCYGKFGIMHSGVTRSALWSAEYLRAEDLQRAKGLKRDGKFHAETRVPASQRAELHDYARSGFDRGHLAPNADMPDRRTQQESFSLANMVPQDSEHNRHIWAPIEQAVREMTKREGSLYVITGPAFKADRLKTAGRVIVPTHMYKLVYSPRQKLGAAWYTENRADAPIQVLSVAQLEREIGIELLPALTAQQKERMLKLPKVKLPKRKKKQAD